MKSMKSRGGRSGGTDRGGIRKRGPTRTDRDGDMDMDGGGARAKRGRGDSGRLAAGGRVQSRDKTMDAIQKAISSSKDSSQVNIRQGKAGGGTWSDSPLVAFLERRMNAMTKSGPRAKITKSRVEGDSLVVFVRSDLADKMLRINGNLFAGIHVSVEPHTSAPSSTLDQDLASAAGTSASTADTKSKMTAILGKRYYPDTKLLDLSKLGTDPDLLAMGIFNTTSTESKFFPALMKVWEMGFTTSAQRREAVQSVSLAHNQLANISVVTTLAQTVPDIKNLDLSNNNFKDAQSLIGWRWKFRNLEFLDLTGNAFSADPSFKDTMLKWYPKLRILNNVEVRTAEEIAAQKKTPIPVQAPYFQDESKIGENFVRAFFAGYDNDRNDLINGVYDDRSTFSLNVNTMAPKAQQAEAAGWDSYIKKSRNLLKISHLPARMSRAYVGAEKIREVWNTLPQTRHPDLTTHPEEMLLECHPIPGLPDPSGQSETGVGGLLVMVHGKVEESVGAKIETRSFDRTFILGPGGGVGGIRVINDILCLRAYGGHEAWSPENQAIPQAVAPPPAPAAVQPGIPDGYGVPAPGKTDTQLQQEQLIAQMSSKSGMTLQFSEMALSGNGWNLDAAWKNFEELKAQGALPTTAFVSGA
ncbi:mRNA export factor mex67 [Penicillium alfredii]|uniref:mRNA export factor MEX67 n=1 Tax=Penicillium alfredii TaxID=1506179 RepID=A0A9W9JXN8_9EURO|nr:mRNA export factor mex67 [Penicillium alfredii]KAJ5084842.1 mRNA export factor mex67 [Penicillium alfredii]